MRELGADVRRAADWDVTQSEFVMSLVASKSATSKSAATSGFLVANSQGEVLLALVLPTHNTPHLVANSDHAGGDSRCRRVELHALHTESRGAASSRAPQDAMLTEIPASDMRSAGIATRLGETPYIYLSIYVYIYLCIYVFMYLSIYLSINIYLHTYIRTYVY
jgi:hypothetical protein